MKRFLSVILAILMVVAVLPTNLFNISAQAISSNDVKSKMDSFMQKYPKGAQNPWNECYDFINELTKEIFNHSLPSQHDSKYKFKDNYKDNFVQIGETLAVSQGNLTQKTLTELLSQALPGDVIQMHYTTYTGALSYHVMAVYSASENGIVLYHAGRYKDRNGDGVKERGRIYLGVGTGSDKLNGSSGKEMPWSDFIKLFSHSKNGISLYRSKKVESQNFQPQILPFSSISSYYDNYDMTVNVFGRDECYNTKIILDNIVNSKIDKQKNIKVQFIDCDGKSKTEVEVMSNKYADSNITFCYDTSNTAYYTMFDFAKKAGFGNSITIPLIVFRKADGTIFKITEGTLESDYLLQLANGDLSGEEIIDLNVSGEENYSYSNEVLNQLNKLRKSLNLSPLTMDKELLDAAMQRAAELSIYYSHTRPNGESAFTVLGNVNGTHGENIAMGQTSAGAVMQSWKNSSGHYANMTNSKFSSVGIGCFKTSDGYLCWVQLFSSAPLSNSINKSGKINATHTIKAQKRNISLGFSPQKDIHTLTKGKYVKIDVWNLNKGFPYSKQIVDGSNFNFTSSNSNIIAIANNGNCTIKGNGTTNVKVTHKADSKVKLTTDYRVGHVYSNTCDITCNYCNAKRTIKHTYSNACDTSCNVCKATRTITHAYKTTTTKATLSKNGSIVKKCTVCGKVASNTAIKYVKSFKLSTTTYTYNGGVKTPTVTVKDSAGKTLKKNTDYTVTYASGRKNAGTYKVTVKMIGKYSGTKTLTFKINPAKISSYNLSATAYTYDGKVKKPAVTVKNSSGTKLTTSSYTVTYASGRKNVGTYKVTIKGKGNYTGTKTLTFKINPAKTTVSKLTAGKKSITVAITKKSTQVTGYQIQYSTSKTFSKATTKTISSYKTTKYTLKSLSAKKTYYVRVRTYKTVNGVKYYSGWSTYKYVKTK